MRAGLDRLKSRLWYQEPATQPKASKNRLVKGVDIHKAISKVAPKKGFFCLGISILDLVTHSSLN